MVDTSWFAYDNQIQSALLALQGGMEGGLAAAELLVGDGNPDVYKRQQVHCGTVR